VALTDRREMTEFVDLIRQDNGFDVPALPGSIYNLARQRADVRILTMAADLNFIETPPETGIANSRPVAFAMLLPNDVLPTPADNQAQNGTAGLLVRARRTAPTMHGPSPLVGVHNGRRRARGHNAATRSFFQLDFAAQANNTSSNYARGRFGRRRAPLS
jgi:hypothetical protein